MHFTTILMRLFDSCLFSLFSLSFQQQQWHMIKLSMKLKLIHWWLRAFFRRYYKTSAASVVMLWSINRRLESEMLKNQQNTSIKHINCLKQKCFDFIWAIWQNIFLFIFLKKKNWKKIQLKSSIVCLNYFIYFPHVNKNYSPFN